MQQIDTDSDHGFFNIVAGTDRSQAATMVLDPEQSTGGPTNYHARSDQWLYVKDGRGTATVDGEEIELARGDLLLIEAGETHEIQGAGTDPLVTVNIYAPPEY